MNVGGWLQLTRFSEDDGMHQNKSRRFRL